MTAPCPRCPHCGQPEGMLEQLVGLLVELVGGERAGELAARLTGELVAWAEGRPLPPATRAPLPDVGAVGRGVLEELRRRREGGR